MIDTERLATFTAAALVLIVVPGPGVLFIVSRGVSYGRRAALATVVGHELGLLTQVLAVAAGIAMVVERSIAVFTVLKLAGAAYLAWLGIDAIRRRRALATAVATEPTLTSSARMTRQGYLVGVSNPKGFVFFASVLPQFVDPALGHVPLQMIGLGLICCTIALISDSVWALAAGTARAWLARSPSRLATIGGAGGVATIALGVRLAATGAVTDQLTPDELARTYAAAWLERDPAKRRELLERCCRPDVRFLQEGFDHEVVGIDELHTTIGEFQSGWPADTAVDVQITTDIQEHHGYGRGGFVWIIGDDRGYGTDFVEVKDGKMQTIVVFGDPGPPQTA